MGEKKKQAKRDRKRATLGSQAIVEGLGGGAFAAAIGVEIARGLLELGLTVGAAQIIGPALALGVVIPAISKLRDLFGRSDS